MSCKIDIKLLYIHSDEKKCLDLCSLLQKNFPSLIHCTRTDDYEADIILLGLDLRLIQRIRSFNRLTPIILIEKTLLKSDLLNLLDKHIDGYININSPNIIEELDRYIYKFSQSKECIDDEISYCYGTKSLIAKDKTIRLTHHESLFLELLLSRRGYILYYSEIEYEIYRDELMSKDALKSLAKKLRKKLPPNILENIPLEGYRLL